ncbi:O-antigen ligase C-terminal domain-containing protein [Variovorax sp. VRV01]|uniref:PglL family O-oligosaccharyltransferase n=1 Tax=Variovorax sp. VRV01 TaxID=2769259 RepID=UPI00178100E0|nr:O-antigen ligase family protein [Variovorax sp. VRV01]MBD9666160.1 O-antigen ligase C-terminal domain-containing protein [Variovorax sp. VRV01]
MYFLGFMLALGLLIPDHFFPWPAFRHDVAVGVGFSVLIFGTAWRQISLPKAALFLVLLSFVPLLQAMAGEVVFWGDGWVSWLYILGAALTMISAANLMNESTLENPLHELQPIVIALVIAAVISVGISLAQWFRLDVEFVSPPLDGIRFGANLAQPNQLAALLLIGLACGVFLFESKIVSAVPGCALALFLLFGLVMTQSRMAILVLIFALTLYFGLRRQARLQLPVKAVLLFSGFFALASLTWSSINSVLLLKVPVSMLERTTNDVRLNLWYSMVDALARAPWFGYGWGQVSVAQQAVALEYPPTYALFDSAHNIFLDIGLWAGLPVALLFSIWLFSWVKEQIINCRDPLSWSILLAIGMIFCHAMVEYPLAYAYILLPVCFFMGALSRGELLIVGRPKSAMLFHFAFVGAKIIVLIAFAVISIEYLRFESDWRRLRFSLANISLEREFDYSRPKFLTQLRDYAEMAKIVPERGMPEKKLLWMKRVSERFGQPSILTKYAIAAALNGRPEAASQSLALICKTQMPRVCRQVLKNWETISSDSNYPEFKAVDIAALIAKN